MLQFIELIYILNRYSIIYQVKCYTIDIIITIQYIQDI